ncbi:hypothetical protein ACH4PU_32315 [Streptomyces sp. NPDC021100]|uniref:hypothetical protein n=1 Tax=Streptomyces sp. NPDC021100 TaxID=3365114 RepID=UPI0037BC7BA9
MTTTQPRRALGRGLRTLIAPAPEPPAAEPALDFSAGAAPGVEEHADATAEAACRLAEAAHPTGWSAVAVEDAVDAIDTLVEALSTLDPHSARLLAPITEATAALLEHLARSQGDDQTAVVADVPIRRRRLGPGRQHEDGRG